MSVDPSVSQPETIQTGETSDASAPSPVVTKIRIPRVRLGDRASALRQYQTCAEILRQELNLRPTQKTEKLRQKVMA